MNRASTLALLVLLATPAQALTVRAFTLPELVRESAVIVRGTVVASRSDWSADRERIYTDATVRVDEALVGKVGPTLTVRQPGGTVDGARARIAGVRYLGVGEHVALFLRTDGERHYLVGFSQGVWYVHGAKGAETVGRRAPAHEVRVATQDSRTEPGPAAPPPEAAREAWTAFRQRVLALRGAP